MTPDISLVEQVLWPAARLGDALRILAQQGGVRAPDEDVPEPPPDLQPDEVGSWLTSAAAREGLETEHVFSAAGDLPHLLGTHGPLVLQVPGPAGLLRFLCLISGGMAAVRALGPDLRVRRIPLQAVVAAMRKGAERTVAPAVERAVGALGLGGRDGVAVRAALIDDHVSGEIVGSCWRVHLPMARGLRAAASEAGLSRSIVLLLTAHVVQAVLFVVSWWLLGRGLLEGTIDRGWLLGWVLLLVSLIPFRLLTTWMQGLTAIAAGLALRRRLLRGALRTNAQRVREQGAGQFYALAAEAAAVESLALGGGVLALLAIVELVLAGLVLWLGAGWMPAAGLGLWLLATGWAARQCLVRRGVWTAERLSMTGQLLERMTGHRTRLVQQCSEGRHRQEDHLLDHYVRTGARMDAWDVRLLAVAPRGWLAVGMVALAPLAAGGLQPGRLAAAIGGLLLAYRALRRLTAGLSDVSGAAVAAQLMTPLLQDAAIAEAPGSPAVVLPGRGGDSSGAAAHARDLAFRYPGAARAALQGCTLQIARGARLLLEGPSGSGKTTFASVLAGLQPPDAGLLLVGGLDRSVLGATGWRARVAMVPQPHDNHIFSGSLAFNLLLGRRWPAGADDLQVAEQVCRELGLGDLLERMPGGLSETVGETGWQLSQGERARVFLARALLQRPELLVLDETFGALDPENIERAIRCVQQRAATVLAIAHA